MARIKTYSIDTLITDEDIVIGSDADNLNQTKNYRASDLRNYMLSGLDPVTGGNLKITTITATDELNLTPEDYINSQDPALEVLNYEIIFLILNGRTYIFRKNGDTFGVGETQTTSDDFTEIDITSIIQANLQDLESVLNEGNEAPDKDAKINNLYLFDDNNGSQYGVYLDGSKESLNIYKEDGTYIATIEQGEITFRNGVYDYITVYPSITSDRTATFQDASGTVAYLSDIPTGFITSVTSDSDEITATTIAGDVVIDYTPNVELKLLKTYLLDTLTDTTYYFDGGEFSYNATTEPINAVKLDFNGDVTVVTTTNFGYYSFQYEDGTNIVAEIPLTGYILSGSSLTVKLDLATYWSDIIGRRLSNFGIHLGVGIIKSSDDVVFDGLTPSGLTNYFNIYTTAESTEPFVTLTRVTEPLGDGVYEYEYSITGTASEAYLQYREIDIDPWSLAGAGTIIEGDNTVSVDLGGTLPPTAQYRVQVNFPGFGVVYSNIE